MKFRRELIGLMSDVVFGEQPGSGGGDCHDGSNYRISDVDIVSLMTGAV